MKPVDLTCVSAVFNVISSGNRERLIECVRSVGRLQTAHEHLVYDGGSSDGTCELLADLARETAGLNVVSEPDSGIYNALNKGVRDAAGQWFYVLGCDDRISDPAAFDAVVRVADGIKEPIVAFGVRKVGVAEPYVRTPCPRDMFWTIPYCHQGVIMRTALIREHDGFDESYRLAADYDLFLRCHLAGASVRVCESCCAEISVGGASFDQVRVLSEFGRILGRVFDLSADERDRAVKRRLLPVRRLLPFLLHRNGVIRTAARYQLCRAAAESLHLLGDDGRLRWR